MTETEIESPTLPTEAEPYVAAVRSLLWSLPADERNELVEDLSAHLAELAAEPGPPLAERLSAPSRYASEFVASAGVEPSRSVLRTPSALRDAIHVPPALRRRLAELRPAWLVLRPFLLAGAIAHLMDNRFLSGGNDMVPLAVVAAAGAAAVAVSQRIGAARGWWDRAVTVAGVVAAIVVANALTSGVQYVYVDNSSYGPTGVLTRGDGSQVSNIWAYDRDGNPIDVFLFDQNGRPLDDIAPEGYDERTGEQLRSEMRTDANGAPVPNLYPRTQTRLRYDDRGMPTERRDRAPAFVTPRLEGEPTTSTTSTTAAPASSTTTVTSAPAGLPSRP